MHVIKSVTMYFVPRIYYCN